MRPISPLDCQIDEIRRVCLFTSPKAGRGQGREQLRRLEHILESNGIECRLIDDVDELVQITNDSLESIAVVAAGGDGTVSLVASKIRDGLPIIPMPLGTENLLAGHFGYQADADFVWQTIQHRQIFRMDAGRANGRLFLVMVTAGFDAEVVRGLHLRRRGHISRWSYAGPIWRALRRYRFTPIRSTPTVPGGVPATGAETGSETDAWDGAWMMAFNLPCYAAALRIEPDASGDDGWLHELCFKRGTIWSGLRYLLGILRGTHLRDAQVQRRKVGTVTWSSCERVPYQIDGDYAGRLPVRIEVLPGLVTMMRPPDWQN
ncbi:MAG: diacylglycerol kinase family protein [Planctomycetota bacterium]